MPKLIKYDPVSNDHHTVEAGLINQLCLTSFIVSAQNGSCFKRSLSFSFHIKNMGN